MKRSHFLAWLCAGAVLACGPADGDLIGERGGGGSAEGGAGGAPGGGAPGGMGGSGASTSGAGGSAFACSPTGTWDAGWETLENDLISLVNQRRQAGGMCGSQTHGPVSTVTLDTTLRDVARAHTEDMAVADYFSWTTDEDESWLEQPNTCGYGGTALGGGLFAGASMAQQTFDSLVSEESICNTIHATATVIGVGYHPGGPFDAYWVLHMGNGD